MTAIVCTWATRLREGRFTVWPDGCRDLVAIISNGRPTTIVCSGLDSSPRRVVCGSDTLFVGVRLAAGVVFPWDKKHPHYKREDLTLSQAQSLRPGGWEVEGDSNEALNHLVGRVNALASPAPVWIPEYIGELRYGRASRTISLSERSIRRKLAEATGAPPKYWQSLARVRQTALALLRSEASLASLAADHGFSDQAHMSREVRRWFGATPVTLRANREQAIERLAAPDVFQML